ncbi:MAG: hypothetical protein COB04_05250 [Gammaproteobacteria bacterium]|nr:MAG: hypothetical protein COB04_05250 [Gammaproteobacteria bacterium]
MNMTKRRILIIDDSPNDIQLLLENLKSEYAVLAATSGEKGLVMARKEPPPDVILLDLEMPDMDGYETCRRLKSDATSRDIDVIFISAHETTKEKIAAYEVGASDYLTKPVQPQELNQKVKLAIEHRDQRISQNEANSTAYAAMSSLGEMGDIINFLGRSTKANSYETLADFVLEATNSYGLIATIQIRTPNKIINQSMINPIPPLESDLLFQLKEGGIFMELGERFVGNFGNVSLLIKNMPKDSAKHDRFRDHLCVLLEGAASKAHSIDVEMQLLEQIQYSNKILIEVQGMQAQYKEATVQIMDDVLEGIEESFVNFGLTDEQETQLLSLVQAGVNKSIENHKHGLRVEERLSDIITNLDKFTHLSQNKFNAEPPQQHQHQQH